MTEVDKMKKLKKLEKQFRKQNGSKSNSVQNEVNEDHIGDV